jgi:cytochrome P450
MANKEKQTGESSFVTTHKLLEMLSDDDERLALYQRLREQGGGLRFQSRADVKDRAWLDGDSKFRQQVVLLTSYDHVHAALTDQKTFSNDPYRALGSGTFMLGLDDEDPKRKDDYNHEMQRAFAKAFIDVNPRTLQALANIAFKAAAVLPLKQRKFDLTELAEQAAARFMGFLFGYEQADHALIQETMRVAYRGLNYLILGRHFVSQPGTIEKASQAMGLLLTRTAALIDLYRKPIGRDQRDEWKRVDDELKELQSFKDRHGHPPLEKFEPLLQILARRAPPAAREYSGAELAVLVVGMMVGTIGNIQASVCIAMNEFFGDDDLLKEAKDRAGKSVGADPDYCESGPLEDLIWEALRRHPPAAFLPRRTTKKVELEGVGEIDPNTQVILAIGGATTDAGGGDKFNKLATKEDEKTRFRKALVFGGEDGVHACIGSRLAMTLVTEIVRKLLVLEGIGEQTDPRTGEAMRLEKDWGFNCRRYPLEHAREHVLIQSPLIVIMRVKTPIAEHAEQLKKVIAYGAPRIEKKLLDSNHVHFASFIFLEGDSKLALYTVYDRDFDAYIEHFALEIGPLFDRIFAHIEDAPPLPVNEFPKEFVDTIRRFNHRPAAGYFFSAYPRAVVASIPKEPKRQP